MRHFVTVGFFLLSLQVFAAVGPETFRAEQDLWLKLQKDGLTVKLGPTAVNHLVRATLDYEPLKAQLHGISGNAPRPKKEPLSIPSPLQQALQKLANHVQETINGVVAQQPYVKALPGRALGQLNQARGMLLDLAQGQCDPECYEIEIISQRLGYAADYLAQWAKDGFQ